MWHSSPCSGGLVVGGGGQVVTEQGVGGSVGGHVSGAIVGGHVGHVGHVSGAIVGGHVGHMVQGVGGGQVVGSIVGGHMISRQVVDEGVGGQVEGSGHVSPKIVWCVHCTAVNISLPVYSIEELYGPGPADVLACT